MEQRQWNDRECFQQLKLHVLSSLMRLHPKLHVFLKGHLIPMFCGNGALVDDD